MQRDKDMNSLGEILTRIKKILGDTPALGFSDRCSSLEQEYSLLLDFMRKGVEDSHREQLYDEMLRKANMLLSDVEFAVKKNENSFLTTCQGVMKNVDTSSVALIEGLTDESQDVSDHFVILNSVFVALIISPQWKEHDSRLWLSYFLSEDTNETDACAMVSAVMLSCMLSFSIEKFKTLAYVYLMSDKQIVRQRALVGLVMCYDACIPYYADAQRQLIMQIVDEEKAFVGDVAATLMQIIRCRNAEKDSRYVENELMSKISKGNKLNITNGKLELDDTSSVDDILNPGESEKAMEEMEKSISKLMDLQKSGVDFYFKGFSHMKRYPFFYKISNWFVPFNIKHPDIQDALKKVGSSGFVSKVMDEGPFCDSDKYSFIFAMTHVMDQLPENVRKMMDNGELAPIGTGAVDNKQNSNPTYLRRMCLQDFYRFFKLFPHKGFDSLFTNNELLSRAESLLAELCHVDAKSAEDYCKFLIRNEEYERAVNVIRKYKTSTPNSLVLLGLAQLKKKKYEEAYESYSQAYFAQDKKTTASVLSGLAKSALLTERYDEAFAHYDSLRKQSPESLPFKMNYVLSGSYVDADTKIINEAYRLDFENESNISIKRLVGWVELMAKRPANARNVYERICADEFGSHNSDDLLNLVYSEICEGDYKSAVVHLADYIVLVAGDDGIDDGVETFYGKISYDHILLEKYELSGSIICLMLDAALKDISER